MVSYSHPQLSPTAVNNLLTMGCCAPIDPRQAVPDQYRVPGLMTRECRARLILEEALETIEALGFDLKHKATGRSIGCMDDVVLVPADRPASLEDIIDGCCDEIYVCTGTLLACGAPDMHHMGIVNAANAAKFPNGVAILNEAGKFQKPPGWVAPVHTPYKGLDLQDATSTILSMVRG